MDLEHQMVFGVSRISVQSDSFEEVQVTLMVVNVVARVFQVAKVLSMIPVLIWVVGTED